VKKVLFFVLVLGVTAAGILFADGYVVQGVTGKVERESSPGKWEAVTEGASLTAATVVNTGLNSTLVLRDGTRTITIRAMQKGAIEKLIGAGSSGGIRIGGKVTETETSTTARGTSSISTASTRASDATNDLEWAE
jgi:hypothetical protein